MFRIRSLGTATTGLSDQYADGKAAKVWALYIGDISRRTDNYRLETKENIWFFICLYFINIPFHLPPLRFHCLPTDAGIEPRTVATGALTNSLNLIHS